MFLGVKIKLESTLSIVDCVRDQCALEKAFAKFINLKETKAELKPPAKTQIEKWKQEVAETQTALANLAGKYEDELAENQKQVLLATIQSTGLIGA